MTEEPTSRPEPNLNIHPQENDGIPLRDFSESKAQRPISQLADEQERGSPVEEHFRVQQAWNNPRSNIWKLSAVFYSLMACGMNDACYGALLPSIGSYYKLNYTVVSLIFLSPFAGYSAAAILSNMVHEKLGQRGVAILGPIPRLIAYIVICVHPPYPVVVVVLALAGLGIGLVDAGWNAYVGNLANTNELLGFLHGFYGVGATISPLIIAAMINKYHLQWYTFFYVMVGVLVVELATSLTVFWKDDGAVYRKKQGGAENQSGMTKLALKQRTTLVCSAFLLAYVGTEVGRFVLGFITPRIGEKLAVSIYLICAAALQLVFWLVPQFIVSAVAVAFIGFFLGPLFPAAIIAVTKILPPKLHVPAIGISASIGGGGAALLPFAVGAVAQAAGVKTLQPIVFGLLVTLLGIWLTLPRIPKHAHTE